ncbi:MAG: hypothetical protein ABI376_02540 [Caulobacteraceae bacterium]
MTAPSARPLPVTLWLLAPWLACAAGQIVLAAPVRVLGLQLPEPVFAFAAAFAWGAIRPSPLPPIALLVMGVFLDALWGAPIGFWALCLLAVYAPALLGRRILAGASFPVLWGWYAAACAMALGVGWAIVAARSGTAPDLVGVFWQWLVTAALYPFAGRLIEGYEEADVRFR